LRISAGVSVVASGGMALAFWLAGLGGAGAVSPREVSEWPPRCRKLVLLERPFKRKHARAPGVEFEKLDDPHYWKAEYRFEVEPGVWDRLACGW
jgi:hypothetical protein